VRVHLKVDTGMHRVGARPEQIVPLVQALLAHPELRWEGLWTHLARADEPAVATTVLQLALLDDVVLALERAGYPPPIVHAANSARGWRGARPPAGTWCAPASRSTGSRRAWSWPGCVASWSRPSRCAPG
jgi:alanine racemase